MRRGRFVAAVLVMALWAMGSYTLGRYHGVTRGPMEVPAVHIQWKKSEEPKPVEAKTPETDFVAISNQACEVKQ
jgi:hypothetical protein